MKKILLMCCFLLGITAVSFAQGRKRMNPTEQAKQLQTKLKLSDDQTAKVTTILTAQAAKRDSIRTASNGDRQAMMQSMMPLMMSTNQQIKAILTTDQSTAYEAMMKERMDRMKSMGGGGVSGGGSSN